jgi:hypothetical protein
MYRGDLLSEDYRDEPGGGYRDGGYQDGGYPEDSRGGGYQDDPLTSAYREDPRDGGHRDDPLTSAYREDPRDGGHRDDPLTGAYREDPLGGSYREDPLTGDYPGGRSGGYAEDRTADYPEEMPDRYREDPLTGDYLTGPGESAVDGLDYPAAPGNAGYSPARPYVAPHPGSAVRPAEGRGRERRRPAREESDPSSGSFPYDGPPAEPEARGRRG